MSGYETQTETSTAAEQVCHADDATATVQRQSLAGADYATGQAALSPTSAAPVQRKIGVRQARGMGVVHSLGGWIKLFASHYNLAPELVGCNV